MRCWRRWTIHGTAAIRSSGRPGATSASATARCCDSRRADTRVDFAPFRDEIKRRLLAASLSREVHWYRTFASVGDNGVDGHDGLLDNQEWAPGVEAVTGWPWPPADKPYALRQFFVMVPDLARTR